MSSLDSTTRHRHIHLPTQQRRLRHLRSVAARNSTSIKSLSDDVANIQTYFTLHKDDTSPAFYTSEKIQGSLNPTWKSFDLNQTKDGLNLASSLVMVRVWCLVKTQVKLIIEWEVNMTGLVYLGDQIHNSAERYNPNTLIFGVYDGFYSAPSQESQSAVSDVTESLLKVDQATVRDSYSVNSLLRIYTVLRAIKQTQASVERVHSRIEDRLLKSQCKTKQLSDHEMLVLKVNQLKKDLEWRTMALHADKEVLERLGSSNQHRDMAVKKKKDTLHRDKDRFQEKKKSYYEARESFVKTNAQLIMRRKQLISELAFIYPVVETSIKGAYTICIVHLPNSEDFAGHDEIQIAVALSFTCHLVHMTSVFLDIPLRYPVDLRGSRSRVRDHVIDKIADKDRDFPLYSKGKERFHFNYGVYLLNKNIAQMRYYCGLGTTDLRQTLPNLKTLLELRLGVKFEHPMSSLAINTMTSVGSHSTPSPGSIASISTLANQNAAKQTAAVQANEKFEQILSETKNGGQDRTKDVNIVDSSKSDQKTDSLAPELFKGVADGFFDVKNPAGSQFSSRDSSVEREFSPAKVKNLILGGLRDSNSDTGSQTGNIEEERAEEDKNMTEESVENDVTNAAESSSVKSGSAEEKNLSRTVQLSNNTVDQHRSLEQMQTNPTLDAATRGQENIDGALTSTESSFQVQTFKTSAMSCRPINEESASAEGENLTNHSGDGRTQTWTESDDEMTHRTDALVNQGSSFKMPKPVIKESEEEQ